MKQFPFETNPWDDRQFGSFLFPRPTASLSLFLGIRRRVGLFQEMARRQGLALLESIDEQAAGNQFPSVDSGFAFSVLSSFFYSQRLQ